MQLVPWHALFIRHVMISLVKWMLSCRQLLALISSSDLTVSRNLWTAGRGHHGSVHTLHGGFLSCSLRKAADVLNKCILSNEWMKESGWMDEWIRTQGLWRYIDCPGMKASARVEPMTRLCFDLPQTKDVQTRLRYPHEQLSDSSPCSSQGFTACLQMQPTDTTHFRRNREVEVDPFMEYLWKGNSPLSLYIALR